MATGNVHIRIRVTASWPPPRSTYRCPGCRRDVGRHEYDLAADSCRTCIEIIPRLQKPCAAPGSTGRIGGAHDQERR
jgi:hypothetical protein